MQKDKRNILIFVIVVVAIIFISYLTFTSGLTLRLKASLENMRKPDITGASSYPVINFVINSSGENYVNSQTVITVNASSIYNISKLEYSFDLKDWKEVKASYNKKDVNAKIVFDKTMNEKIYIRAVNEKGYKSYPYESVVKIDKEKPSLKVIKQDGDFLIIASDNIALECIQYSVDGINWNEEKATGYSETVRKKDFNYKYVRAVDFVGNIGKVVTIK